MPRPGPEPTLLSSTIPYPPARAANGEPEPACIIEYRLVSAFGSVLVPCYTAGANTFDCRL
jgi:hypothetical protein